MSEEAPFGPKEILSEEEIDRLTIIKNSLLRKSIRINGDGVIIYGDVFGEKITIDLNGIMIIDGNIGVYDTLEVIGHEGGMLFINGNVYPGSRIVLQNTIVLGGIMGSNITLSKIVAIGPVIARPRKEDNKESIQLKVKQSLASSFITVGKLTIEDSSILFPLLYGAKDIEITGKIFVIGREGIEELNTLVEQVRDGLSRIRYLNDPLESVTTFSKSLDPGNRNINKIIERIEQTAIQVYDSGSIRVNKGLVPLFISCFPYNLRKSLEESISDLEKLFKKINIFGIRV